MYTLQLLLVAFHESLWFLLAWKKENWQQLPVLHIQFLVIFASFKKAIQDSDNDDDFLKVREKTSEEKVI